MWHTILRRYCLKCITIHNSVLHIAKANLTATSLSEGFLRHSMSKKFYVFTQCKCTRSVGVPSGKQHSLQIPESNLMFTRSPKSTKITYITSVVSACYSSRTHHALRENRQEWIPEQSMAVLVRQHRDVSLPQSIGKLSVCIRSCNQTVQILQTRAGFLVIGISCDEN